MKKNYSNSNEISQREVQDQSKKLYRSITEQGKRLDDERGCVKRVGDLFTPPLQIQRKKFQEYCERLILSDPVLFGHKAEELLWRKTYYDIVSTAKRLKKHEYTEEDRCKLEAHINAGVGYYHHLILKLQSEFNLNLHGVVDFAIFPTDKLKNNKNKAEAAVEWAKDCIHRCLIYLGDLCRYKLEIYPNWDPSLAIRYYCQALSFKPKYGMPHNQMGTLASNMNRTLDAVYHYMRCLSCPISFEGTENNLQRLFEKNSQYLEKLPNENENPDSVIQIERSDHIKQLLARFLLLIDVWYFNKTIPHIYNLCHQTYIDLEECLTYYKPLSSESGDTQTELDSIETDSSSTFNYLSSDTLFKIIVICFMCISKLQKTQSNHLSTAIAFTLAVYSQLIQNIISHVQQGILSFPLPDLTSVQTNNITKKSKKIKPKGKMKLRRRRKSLGDSDDSEFSEPESLSNSSSSSDESDVEVQLASSSDEELEGEEKKSDDSIPPDSIHQNGVDEKANDDKNNLDIVLRSKSISAEDMLEIISEEGLLQSVKIVNDWLSLEVDVLKSCCKSTRSLLRQVTHLLNLINVAINNTKLDGVKLNVVAVHKDLEKIGLPEDVILKGLEILKGCQINVDWNYFGNRSLTTKEECVVRIMKLVSFGKYLTTVKESGVEYNEEKQMFVCELAEEEENDKVPAVSIEELEKQNNENEETITNKLDIKELESHGQLSHIKMKHMGQLWLAAEVNALESRIKGKASLSPYLVLDADALIKYTFMVKHLVNSRKFIILVPSAVVSALDDLKRDKIEARDAIRWLESQFSQGNRFFRAQRPHERASLPFIKYPKKKDKTAFIYIQIIECCHYLTQQQKGASNLVTLLIGNQNATSNGENKEISYVGLAQSAGIHLELITQFYSKWKKSGRGKR